MVSKVFTILENNPDVLNSLAYQLGLSPDLSFHDVYSLSDQDLLALIPRPVDALLAIIPMTEAWKQSRLTEDGNFDAAAAKTTTTTDHSQSSHLDSEEPVLWFKQTITHGCGSIGMLHCVANGSARDMILPNSELDRLVQDAKPLKMAERAKLLEDSEALYAAHQVAAQAGDTRPPISDEVAERIGQHFVAFVKGKDGHLWELEGSRNGPLDRGLLGDDEDALSKKAIRLGIGRLIEMEKANGGKDLRFSCVALGPAIHE